MHGGGVDASVATFMLIVAPSTDAEEVARLLPRTGTQEKVTLSWECSAPLGPALEHAARHFGIFPEYASFSLSGEDERPPAASGEGPGELPRAVTASSTAEMLGVAGRMLGLTVRATAESPEACSPGDDFLVGARISAEWNHRGIIKWGSVPRSSGLVVETKREIADVLRLS